MFAPTLQNYVELLTSPTYLTFFRNSAMVAVLVVVITMLVSIPAAFSLSRMKFWGSATLATGVFLTYLIPDTLLFIPLFKIFAFLHELTGIEFINHWWVLVILYPTLTIPFCTWIMIGYFSSIPKELDEAALIDGAGYFQLLTKIFIPVALPGIIAATIFAFTVRLGAVPLSAGVHHLGRSTGSAGRHRHDADQGRRVQLGPDHDRRPAGRRTAADHLRLPDGLLHRRPDGGCHQGIRIPGPAMAQVLLRNVTKMYDETLAVRGIDLDIADKEFVVLVGPSGCGKSTTLRMIAGLEDITDGEVLIGGDVVNDVPPKDRDIAMVFQNYALYPHMTVFENMSFGLRLQESPEGRRSRRGWRTPRASSTSASCWSASRSSSPAGSGSAWRWAARSCAIRRCSCSTSRCRISTPSCASRCAPRSRELHQKVRTTTIYVTHDQVEAMTLADRVVVMNAGLIEQVGAPNELYHAPATRFVAGFIGSPAMNFVPCGPRGVGRRAARPARRRHRVPRAGESHRALPAACRPRRSPVRLEARAHHGTAPDPGAESASLRSPARRHRTDGNGYAGSLPGERNGGVRAGQPERRTAGRQPRQAGCRSQPHASDRKRNRKGPLSMGAATLAIPANVLQQLVADIFDTAGCSRSEAERIGRYLVARQSRRGTIATASSASRAISRCSATDSSGRSEGRRADRYAGRWRWSTASTDSVRPWHRRRSQIGIEKCQRMGLAAVALRNSGHIGRVGDWAEMAAAAGLISIHFVNATGSVIVAPFGSVERRFSTAPYCVGVPVPGRSALVLDFATSLSPKARCWSRAKAAAAFPPMR